jgi:hypothetical protein
MVSPRFPALAVRFETATSGGAATAVWMSPCRGKHIICDAHGLICSGNIILCNYRYGHSMIFTTVLFGIFDMIYAINIGYDMHI